VYASFRRKIKCVCVEGRGRGRIGAFGAFGALGAARAPRGARRTRRALSRLAREMDHHSNATSFCRMPGG
jgi:hypothetical protein